jgi:hypothetical protein
MPAMRLLMFVCRDPSIEFTPEDRANIGPQVGAWVEEMERRGVRERGDVLAPPDATVAVRVRAEKVTVKRGPLIDTPEPISGFNLLNCASVDEAIEVSAKHPIARFGTIELRPIVET